MRTVLISGASRGLGAAFAAHYAAAGDRVFSGVRAGSTAPAGEAVELNVRDVDSVREAVSTVMTTSESIDLLVNNAGIHLAGRLADLELDDFKTILDINLLGAWRLTKAALPHMRPGSTIAMISSLSGLVGLPEDGAYAASKFALEGMSQALAAEVAPLGIRVRIFEPSGIATEFTDTSQGDDPALVASEIAAIIDRPDAPFRNLLGKSGAYLTNTLKVDDGSLTRAIVRDISGIEWC